MTAPIRFHLDESADGRIAAGLKRRNRDCTTSYDADLLSLPDEDQLAFATREKRVLITRDYDFCELATQYDQHSGIVICKPRSHFGSIVKRLDQMASEMSADDFANRVFFL